CRRKSDSFDAMRCSGGRRAPAGGAASTDRCDEETGPAAATPNVEEARGESLRLIAPGVRRDARVNRQNLAHDKRGGKRRTLQGARGFDGRVLLAKTSALTAALRRLRL